MVLTQDDIFRALALVVVGAPVSMVGLLGSASLLERPFSERQISRIVQSSICAGLVAAVAILTLMLTWNTRHVPIAIGSWVNIPEYHFTIKFTFDRLSVPFVILTFVLCGTIGAFANRYLHRERGFNRFFLLYSLFVMGMITATLAGTIETLFAGWELVGLSSAMLVAYFHDRPSPVTNGLRVWSVYRISDAALLIASIELHHVAGGGDFDQLFQSMVRAWPYEHAPLVPWSSAVLIGSLLLVAAMGKSALVPFSGWLPRAMEGPTPSSAVFYGALSVHLGAFLLLRFSPLLVLVPGLQVAIVIIGLLTAAFAALAERVQTDIKSDLSFASLTQVGIIVAEIGMGLRYVALIHILGHACFRTLQFLRAPTILYDYSKLENALGSHLQQPEHNAQMEAVSPRSKWLYPFATEQGYLDALLNTYVVTPFLWYFGKLDRFERACMKLLSGDNPVTKAPNGESTADLSEEAP